MELYTSLHEQVSWVQVKSPHKVLAPDGASFRGLFIIDKEIVDCIERAFGAFPSAARSAR